MQADFDKQVLADTSAATAGGVTGKKGRAAAETAAAKGTAAPRPATATRSDPKRPVSAGPKTGGPQKGKVKKKAADPTVIMHRHACST